jgi:hypothetical protein
MYIESERETHACIGRRRLTQWSCMQRRRMTQWKAG